ncbi:MAG: hypothetical protein M1820_003986 [Bogoriella megaspora]|nr:MAG: hypothetical protein M1820_003986 [Bogoriella megaspora]
MLSAVVIALFGVHFGSAFPLVTRQAQDTFNSPQCAVLPPSTTACGSSDLTPTNWVNDCIDVFVPMSLNAFPPDANWPNVIAQSENPSANMACNSLTDSSSCSFPSGDNGVCSNTPDAFQDAFIIQSFLNIYQTLANINQAVQPAHDQLSNSGFVDSMVNDVGREKLPIPRSVLFKLVDLSLNFLPIPAEPELQAFKNVMKAFKKIGKKAVSQAEDSAADQENTDNQQPSILKAQLDQTVPDMQSALQDQLNDIFVNGHDDDPSFYADLLVNGYHLSSVPSVNDFTNSIAQNLKSYLIAQMMANTGMTLLIDSIVESCDFPDSNDGNGKCRRLVYAEPNTPVTVATVDRPQNIGNLPSYGVLINDVMNNALDCNGGGKTFNDVDFEGFLETTTQTYPSCLFGIPVIEQK